MADAKGTSVKLERMKTLNKSTRDRLRRGGIHSVEDLALVDVGSRAVPGVPPARLSELRRAAQRTIFEGAIARVRRLADETLEPLERVVADARKRARGAFKTARTQARGLARTASVQTRKAARAAEREVERLERELQKSSPKSRAALRQAQAQARKARVVAQRAAKGAVQVAKSARRSLGRDLAAAKTRGAALVERLRKTSPGGNGHRRARAG